MRWMRTWWMAVAVAVASSVAVADDDPFDECVWTKKRVEAGVECRGVVHCAGATVKLSIPWNDIDIELESSLPKDGCCIVVIVWPRHDEPMAGHNRLFEWKDQFGLALKGACDSPFFMFFWKDPVCEYEFMTRFGSYPLLVELTCAGFEE